MGVLNMRKREQRVPSEAEGQALGLMEKHDRPIVDPGHKLCGLNIESSVFNSLLNNGWIVVQHAGHFVTTKREALDNLPVAEPVPTVCQTDVELRQQFCRVSK